MAGEEGVPNNVKSTEDWVKQWDKNERDIDFHKDYVNPVLVNNASAMFNGRSGIRVFFPLCGKTLDMKWVADLGHTVIGVEAAENAVEEFFEENNIPFTTQKVPAVEGTLYQSEDKKIRLYCCDFYKFTKEVDGQFDAVFDRSSLVAINVEDREKYAVLLKSLMTPDCRYLLCAMNYDETKCGGPPHHLADESVHKLFSDSCTVEVIDDVDISSPLFKEKYGLDWIREKTLLITPK